MLEPVIVVTNERRTGRPSGWSYSKRQSETSFWTGAFVVDRADHEQVIRVEDERQSLRSRPLTSGPVRSRSVTRRWPSTVVALELDDFVVGREAGPP